MSTPWTETLFPYGSPVGVAPASSLTNDLQLNKNNPGVQFSGTEANAVFAEEREIAGDLWFVTNATYASVANPGVWVQVNAAAASYALVLRAAGQIQRLTAPAAAPLPIVWTTVASTDALGNATLTTGALTTPTLVPLVVNTTWNAPAQAMTAVRANVTDTASAANSLLLDLQVGGVSKFSVRKDGTVTTGLLTGYIDTSATPQTKAGTFTSGPATSSSLYQANQLIASGRLASVTRTGSAALSTGSVQLGDVAYLAMTEDWQESNAGGVSFRRSDTGAYVPLYTGGVNLQTGQFTGSGAGLSGVPWTALPYTPVQSVAAGSTKITVGGTATAPTVDVNPANFAAGSIANSALATTPLDTSSAAQTKAGPLTAGPTPTGSINSTLELVANGRLATVSTTGATGALAFGATGGIGLLQYGEDVAGVFSHRRTDTGNYVPALGGTNSAVGGYLPPVYNAAGAALASTTHIVEGTFTGTGAAVTVNFTGAAAFSSSSYFLMIIGDNSTFPNATRAAGSFTTTAATSNAVNYTYLAVGA